MYVSVSVQRKAGKSHHVLRGGKGQSGTGALESESGIGREEEILCMPSYNSKRRLGRHCTQSLLTSKKPNIIAELDVAVSLNTGMVCCSDRCRETTASIPTP